MQRFTEEYRRDTAAIEARSADQPDPTGKFAFQAGAYKAIAHYFAQMADNTVAHHTLTVRTARRLVQAFCDTPGGPSADDIADLLQAVWEYLRLRPELEDVRFTLEGAVTEARAAGERERRRMEEDAADALIAARSDEAYDRKVDAALCRAGVTP